MLLYTRSLLLVAVFFFSTNTYAQHDTQFSLKTSSNQSDLAGNTHVRKQYLIGGRPVLGAEIVEHYGPGGSLKSTVATPRFTVASGPTSGGVGSPKGGDERARSAGAGFRTELDAFAKAKLDDGAAYRIRRGTPVYTSRHPWDKTLPLHACHTFELSGEDGKAYRIYLSERTGKLVFSYPLHCTFLHDLEPNPHDKSYRGSDQEDADLATEETYNMFRYTFGRNGYDGADGPMTNNINVRNRRCPNAFAYGRRVDYCTGTVADDVVAHEWTHNYLSSMNGLLYVFESGAINESFCDIFGEIVDQENGWGMDEGADGVRTGCEDASTRWKIGEELVVFETNLRDMQTPACRNHPGSLGSDFFVCTDIDDDLGGVHINSGVVNRLFTLLADGGTLNGIRTEPIGKDEAAHLFYQVMAHYLTPTTTYRELADHLVQAGFDLLNAPLPALTVTPAPASAPKVTIEIADLSQVVNAIAATRLDKTSPCTPRPALSPETPEVCADARVLFRETWEYGVDDWTFNERIGNRNVWIERMWRNQGKLPKSRPGRGMYAPNVHEGDCDLNLQHGYVGLTSPSIELPRGADGYWLTFNHYFSIEAFKDGGIVYVSLNDGKFVRVEVNAFTHNGYTDKLRPTHNINPEAGQWAFTGSDDNSAAGSWGQSQVDLSYTGAGGGDRVRVRFVMSHDACDGWDGWYLDEVTLGFCGTAALPVSYTSLTARAAKEDVRVRWTTAEEIDNEGFFVERRAGDETDFRPLGFVAAGRGDYVFTDRETTGGTTYFYRLRQRDLDGTEELSEIVSVATPGGGQLRVWPNPTRDELFVRSPEAGGIARLYDGTGRLWLEQDLAVGGYRLSLTELPPGIYLLKVKDELRRVAVVR